MVPVTTSPHDSVSQELLEALHGAWLWVPGFRDPPVLDCRGCSDTKLEALAPPEHGGFAPQPLGFAVDVDLGLVRSQSCKQSVAGGDPKRSPTSYPQHDCTGATCVGGRSDGRQHQLFLEKGNKQTPSLSATRTTRWVSRGCLMEPPQLLEAARVFVCER